MRKSIIYINCHPKLEVGYQCVWQYGSVIKDSLICSAFHKDDFILWVVSPEQTVAAVSRWVCVLPLHI